jgi:hypothetical protein
VPPQSQIEPTAGTAFAWRVNEVHAPVVTPGRLPAIPPRELRVFRRFVRITGMDIGVRLQPARPSGVTDGDPREMVAFAVLAEHLGFTLLFVNDSLLSPRIEALTMVAALAPVTERAALYTCALLPART